MTGQELYPRTAKLFRVLPLSAVMVCFSTTAIAQAQTLQGGVRDQEYIPGSSQDSSSYPAPQMVPATPTNNNGAHSARLNGNANASGQPQTILQSNATRVVLPPAFLGVWHVQGKRKTVEAQPEFQQGADQAFSTSNQQIWTIQGNQGGYTLGSNTGIQTAIYVDKVQGTTAFIRYQHPVGNTIAQEAIVMSLTAGGAQFNGLERISIVKQGVNQPRAKVTYELVGARQR